MGDRAIKPSRNVHLRIRNEVRLAAAVAVTLATLAWASSAESRTAATACAPKTTTAGGVAKVAFCGPAVATVRAAGKTFRITRGTCATQAGTLVAQVGTIGGPKQGAFQRLPLFYLLADVSAPAKKSILYWIVDGKRYAAAPGVRVTRQQRKVTFSGHLIKAVGYTGSGAFSGSLTC